MTESKGLKGQAGQSGSGTASQGRRRGRWRPYAGTVVTLAVVFGGSAVIGAHVRGTKENAVKAPAGAVGTGKLAMPLKPAPPVTLTVYEDLRSPESKAFAQEYADTFDRLLATGQVQINYRLVTPTDASIGGRGSLSAANAAACAQDQGRLEAYVAQVWKHQPADPRDDAFASWKLLKELGKKARGLDEAKFVPCVQEGDHDGWVKNSQEAFTAVGFGDVPVVLQVNDETVADAAGGLTPAKLRTLVRRAVDQAVAAIPTR